MSAVDARRVSEAPPPGPVKLQPSGAHRGKEVVYAGYLVQRLDPETRDAKGRAPGQPGFVPPAPLYTSDYVDHNGLGPGHREFVPPFAGVRDETQRTAKMNGLRRGYDAEYRDVNGKSPGMPGFVPPVYDSEYSDASGRRVAEEGFIPPTVWVKGEEHLFQALPAGCYTAWYRDANWRGPGDKGFIPPLLAKDGRDADYAASNLPQGYVRPCGAVCSVVRCVVWCGVQCGVRQGRP